VGHERAHRESTARRVGSLIEDRTRKAVDDAWSAGQDGLETAQMAK
jgi:hypothetical protein